MSLTRRAILSATVGAMTTTLLRATVQNSDIAGAAHSVLIDGADTPTTALGRPGYAPQAGDRVLIQQIGNQTANVGLAAGTPILVGELKTADDLADGTGSTGGGPKGIWLGTSTFSSVIRMWGGYHNGEYHGGLVTLPGTTPGIELFTPYAPGLNVYSNDIGTLSLIAGANNNAVPPLLTLNGDFQASGAVTGGGNATFANRVTANQLEMDAPPTTTSAANVFVGSGGLLNKVTSLKAHKLHRKPLAFDSARAVLQIQTATWYDRTQVEENGDSTEGLRRIVGHIAEQVEEVAPQFATYDEEGNLDGVDYRAISAALLDVVKDLEKRVSALEAHAHNS